MSGSECDMSSGAEGRHVQTRPCELAARVLGLCERRGLTLATAESCTGGLIAAALTDIAGSSTCFKGGVVSYWADVKESVLGVDSAIIEEQGVVSRACAEAMARGVAERLACTCAVATTGIAGPGGAEPGKPVGTVWIAVLTPHGQTARCIHANGGRAAVREQAVACALDLLASELELCS